MSSSSPERRSGSSSSVKSHAARYRRVAEAFGSRVDAVPSDAWENDAPCEGWVARDVVRHLVEWVPAFLATYASVEMAPMPSVDDDPKAAWRALDDALRAVLDDAEQADRTFEMRGATYTVSQAVDTFCTGDLVVHTWDLARATGLDETLDPAEVHAMYEGMLPLDEMLRQSGHYGPRVDVPEDADEQTKLLAFTGRRP